MKFMHEGIHLRKSTLRSHIYLHYAIQDTSDLPNTTWPLSVGSSVLVHLTTGNCKYLRDIGDFCISVDVNSGLPGLVLSDLTFDGVLEHAVEEPEFGSLLTMEWARKIREAADHEVVFVLRQCLVTSEYTVRHLKWDEIPQLDPRNLNGHALPEYTPGEVHSSTDSWLNINNSGLNLEMGHRKRHSPHKLLSGGFVNGGFCDGDPSNPGLAGALCNSPGFPPFSTLDSHSELSCGDSTPHHTCATCHDHVRDQRQPLPHPCSTSGPSHCTLSTSVAPSSSYSHYGTWHGTRHSKKRADADKRIILSQGLSLHPQVDTTLSQDNSDTSQDTRSTEDHASTDQCTSLTGQTSVNKVDAPQCITDVDNDLLWSGVAILPGCTDYDGRHLIYIFTCSSLWYDRRVDSVQLARLLLYYYSIPRRRNSGEEWSLVADIREASNSTVNRLLESIYLFQESCGQSISVVYLYADRTSQSHVMKSPLYDSKAKVTLKILLTIDLLLQHINVEQLPTVLEGSFAYDHEAWVRFRKKLEPFLSNCRLVACRLVDAMQHVTASDLLPQSVAQSTEMIQAHETAVREVFEDETLLVLQSDGPSIISSLKREEEFFSHSQDYRFSMEQVEDIHHHLQDSITRLARLADTRMNKLHNCLQLREYEEECHKVIEWLSQDGGTILQRHSVTADNLKAVRHQQKDFEKFYFSAMSYIEKGHDLLEEASMLSQCGNFSEATGYKDLAKTLKRQLQTFTVQLEEARERIEGTAKCYQLLDKSYEWALEAMKYVSSMKMEHTATAEGLDKLLRSLNIYLSEHPPVEEDSFSNMTEAAQNLKNEKLLEQSRVAKARCQEIYQLLQLRQTTLRRARNQLEVEQALKEDGKESREMPVPVSTSALDVSKDYSDHERSSYSTTSSVFSPLYSRRDSGGEGGPLRQSLSWEPHDTSTPTFTGWGGGRSDGRRPGAVPRAPLSPTECLSYQHKDLYSPTPASPYSSASSSSSGKSPSKSLTSSSSSSSQPIVPSVTLPESPTLITPDPPNKGRLYQPSPCRLYNASPTRGSAVPTVPKLSLGRTVSHPATSGMAIQSSGAPPQSSSRHQKKVLKRSSTAPIPMLTSPIQEEDSSLQTSSPTEDGCTREEKSVKSLGITGSTESLPSMPEEAEDGDLDLSPSHDHQEDANSTTQSIRDWTPVPVNTHLHRSARSTPTGPMADLRLTEAEIKSRRTVSLIMSEMIQTERDYVRALQFITDHYVPELQRDDVPQMLRGKRTVIFGNLEKIQQFHSQYFLKQLESCQHQPFLVGQYFLQHETMFYLYALYNKNKPKSDVLMMEYGKDFFRQKQLELGDKMDLSSYLLKPVQRMGKYALLLKQLLKECSETEPEFPELKAAEEMVKFQLRHGNDLLAMDSLRDCDVNLQEQGRLLRQEEFLVFQGRKKSMRRIFLFEDLILFSKTKRGRQGQHDLYVYKSSFKTADIGMTENYGDSGYKFEIWFRRRSVGENYVLQAPSTEVKKAWVKDISRLLWRQAIRNRETRINELATMGIGNKPCLDIKPSEDNIQDRSINVALNNRGARTRNSIAVSSFDYLRNGNKRPHSIISVSSTSSSGSSHSSFGLLGSLNLAFDPLDSPRLNRRSFTSNESGIATNSDTSTDLGTENRGPSLRRGSQGSAPLSTMRSYLDVMKSRVLKQKYSDQLYTDV
ncbi:uncharacterized protein LOC106076280 isoform X3 [Biomphalaria glabrata]|uniref:Uncharacterized protein LOC106076280 isoform X3 n=1 Tax=Biomphalaria glabrata TaxID=6526 RepID=A0A9W3AU54_BIOGL|nr:uncharacterized protein LOC106076280 isoform X3 [Biomphalaria glabrata]